MRKIIDNSYIGTCYIGKEEENAAIRVIRSQSLFRYEGPNLQYETEKFEKQIVSKLNSDYALACSSGAAALKLCGVALDLGIGDEVIMSPLTFIASAGMMLSCGAIPRFVDIDESFNIDVQKIEEKINERTKAVMAIHIQGVPCDMDTITEIARRHSLYVIEDVAQAFGAKYNGTYLGTIGDVSACSLQAGKIITCGEGGIFLCKDPEYFRRARDYHDNGGHRIGCSYPSWDGLDSTYGENFKITEIQSAIASVQLNRLDEIISRQKMLFSRITEGFRLRTGVKLRKVPVNAEVVPVSICMTFEQKKHCDKFIEMCSDASIPFRRYFDLLLTEFTTFKYGKSWSKTGYPYCYNEQYKADECPVSEDLKNRTAWMKLSPMLTEEDEDYIVNCVNVFLDRIL